MARGRVERGIESCANDGGKGLREEHERFGVGGGGSGEETFGEGREG